MNERERTNRLRELEAWLRTHYVRETWAYEEVRKAMEEYCLYKWATSDSWAKNAAKIVQLRTTKTLPTKIEEPIVARPIEEEAEMTVTEILQAHVNDNPSVYNPPKADFKVIEEKDVG